MNDERVAAELDIIAVRIKDVVTSIDLRTLTETADAVTMKTVVTVIMRLMEDHEAVSQLKNKILEKYLDEKKQKQEALPCVTDPEKLIV